jgi:hypothetical protein
MGPVIVIIFIIIIIIIIDLQPFVGLRPLFQVFDLIHSRCTPWTGDQPVARPLPKHRIRTDFHASSWIPTHDPSVRASEDSSCLRPRGHSDRQDLLLPYKI